MILTSASLAAFVLGGCGGQGTTAKQSASASSEVSASGASSKTVTKPEKITMMVDGTLIAGDKGRNEFEAEWEAQTGIDLVIIQPEHDVYYEEVGKAFDSGELPDVVLLSSTYYAKYAAEDMLADISSYYDGSALQKRISDAGNAAMIDGIRISGKLFGIAPTRGNGCATYVKEAWLENCGLSAPTNYEEYIAMLDAFTNGDPDGDGINGNTYGVSASGLINGEAPYVNYLPEFFQDAYPSFYKKEDGTWVDGFMEESMRGAMERLQSAFQAGYIDPEVLSNSTGNCRDKYYEDKYGVFTYWAGTWGNTLSNKLAEAGKDDRIVTLKPIAETGQYLERVAPVWCITSACKNPAGVYEWFLSTMLDGAAVETAWTYVPGNEKLTKCHLDRMLEIVPIANDPGAASASKKAMDALAVFQANCRMADLPYSTEAFATYNDELMALKTELVAKVVTEGMSIDDAYKEFAARGGETMSEAVIESLNAE